jgi:hypothetical protein
LIQAAYVKYSRYSLSTGIFGCKKKSITVFVGSSQPENSKSKKTGPLVVLSAL